ncbi:MAG: ABC transporter ATP-binding protein [Xanthobacteraceae bacterium]|nr:ABC transporter ATP-binding protein [Xanthobacteraceae bacterium]QYK46609.1 MAG: ABC transporter ATP-binding protein [Xanthobacteraceae bacterium]
MSGIAIEVDNVSKFFAGLRAVDSVSLAIPQGERRVLLGPNGAGKTTLFHCISGTHKPSAGRIMLLGRDISHASENERTALGMGRTFQISNVCTELTALENILLGMLGTSPRKWSMMKPVTSYDDLMKGAKAALIRVGLEGRENEEVNSMSYGERRQLELALALSSNPRVLLLDEPCAGLSPSERTHFSKMISGLSRDITLLMIEHDIDVALALADRVTVLHRGKLIFDGLPDEVQKDSAVKEVYFGRL